MDRDFLDLDVLVLIFFVEAIRFFHLFNTNRSDFFILLPHPDRVTPKLPTALLNARLFCFRVYSCLHSCLVASFNWVTIGQDFPQGNRSVYKIEASS